jgi:hypothetical protein
MSDLAPGHWCCRYGTWRMYSGSTLRPYSAWTWPASNYKNSSVPAIPCSSLQHTEYFRFLCPSWNLPVASCRFSPKEFHLWEHIDANIRNKPVIKEEGIGVHLRVSSSDNQKSWMGQYEFENSLVLEQNCMSNSKVFPGGVGHGHG